jgi:ParB-like chromosome segregation protein Spo0J
MDALLQDIPIDCLIPHPENSNHMTAEMLGKLRRHIERTGRYEPLTVRPHPNAEGKYEILNGHNRLRVLRAIGRDPARCVVWDVDDDQARLYLATLNRLAGRDIPERRAALLEGLLRTFDIAELSALLPDDRRQLEELERLSRLEPEDLVAAGAPDKHGPSVPVILDFVLEEAEAKEVNLALDMIRASAEKEISGGQALVRLARFYLAHCRPNPAA